MGTRVFDSLTLPNGTTLINRIAKAAMEENMSDCNLLPSKGIINLYKNGHQAVQAF